MFNKKVTPLCVNFRPVYDKNKITFVCIHSDIFEVKIYLHELGIFEKVKAIGVVGRYSNRHLCVLKKRFFCLISVERINRELCFILTPKW